jgi:EpsD family peptidyl-prolyl cis-trans isomerase
MKAAIACICSVIAVCFALSACNKRPTTQGATLVKVDGEEITARELQEAQENIDGKRAAGDEALEALVDQTLLRNAALHMNLESDPQVEAAIANAKSRILAQAYLARKAAQSGAPTQREIDDYFAKHPERFAERKLIEFNVLALEGADKNEEFKHTVDAAKTLDDVAAWLDGRNLPYARSHLVRSSADLPAALAQRLRTIGIGGKSEPLTIVDGANTLVVEVAGVTASPIGREEAQQRIVRELLEHKSQEIAKAEVARLRSVAKLDYLNRPVPRVAGARAGNADTGHVISE